MTSLKHDGIPDSAPWFFFVLEHRNKFALLLQDVKVNLLNCVSIHAEIVRLSDCGTFLCQLFLTWCCKGHNWNLRIAFLKKFLLFTAFDRHNSIQFCRAAHISNGSDTPFSLYPCLGTAPNLLL